MGIIDLTCKYQQDIYDRKPLASVLSNRKIRFINPEGKFDYTTFGNFYFPTPNKMMLITDDNKYTWYHKPDQLSNTLWSTVPVIFAGVSTGWKDDTWREIYTGDIVTAKNKCMTSVVRYLSHSEQPSLAGDNCDMLFTDCNEGLHIEGTSFCDLTNEMFEFIDISDFMWATDQFCQGGYSVEEVILKAKSSSNRPKFRDTLKIEKGYPSIY